MQYTVSFSGGDVRYLFHTAFDAVGQQVDMANCIIITDSYVAELYEQRFAQFKAVIVIPAGEEHKNFSSLLSATQQLLELDANRNSFLLAVGGGMITDITGFIASVYMRGVPYGYVPTSLLGMVDASVGGKNGINIGLQKNLLGTINQPKFILFDHHFLKTLPNIEWSNGFAEVIKYACLFDEDLFNELSANDIGYYQTNHAALAGLIAKCVDWKNKIVTADEYEKDMRKVLNFGHTAGHAIETICKIPHGQAVGLGMLVACQLSEQYGLSNTVTERLYGLLQQYQLPVTVNAETSQLMQVLAHDKKTNNEGIDFILLEKIGKAVIKNLTPETIQPAIEHFIHASNH